MLLIVDVGGSFEIFVVSDLVLVSVIEVSVFDLILSNVIIVIFVEVGFMDFVVMVIDSIILGSVENGVSVFSYFVESMLCVSNFILLKNGSDVISVVGSFYLGGNGVVLEGVVLLDNGGVGVDNLGVGVKIFNSEIRGNLIGLLGGVVWNYFGGGFNIMDMIIVDSEEEGVVFGYLDYLNFECFFIIGSGGVGVVVSNFFVFVIICVSMILDNGEGGVDFGICDNELIIVNFIFF